MGTDVLYYECFLLRRFGVPYKDRLLRELRRKNASARDIMCTFVTRLKFPLL
jgi:hypothetical protein